MLFAFCIFVSIGAQIVISFLNNKLHVIWPFGAFGIVALILWNTNLLFQRLKLEERAKMELWAMALQESIQNNEPSNLALEVLLQTGENPMIQVDVKGEIIDFKNIPSSYAIEDSTRLYRYLTKIKKENAPIPIRYQPPGALKPLVDQRLYYGDSATLKKLQYYPLALLLIIFLFGTVVYFVFKTNQIASQNRLWAGMAKETAHQIGTPLSSLIGWITLMKEKEGQQHSLQEIEKDVNRLRLITDRFSKIGSLPTLEQEDIVGIVAQTSNYLAARSSKWLVFDIQLPQKAIVIPCNALLMSWTLENIIKNGIDAMKGKGTLGLTLEEQKDRMIIQISDTGSGIKKEDQKKIFSPGFSTKAHGWGLGLSLAKRIVVDYHKGKISIKHTQLGKGTQFEIILFKAKE